MTKKQLFADLDSILEGKIFDESDAPTETGPAATPVASERSTPAPVASPKRSERGTFLPAPTKKGPPARVEESPKGNVGADDANDAGNDSGTPA